MNNTQQTTQPVEVCSQLLLIAMRQVCRALIEEEIGIMIRTNKDLNEVITSRINDVLKVREDDRAKADEQLIEMIVDRKIDRHSLDEFHPAQHELERQIEDGISDAIREHERDEHEENERDESRFVTREGLKDAIENDCEVVIGRMARDAAEQEMRDHERNYDHDDIPTQRDVEDLESRIDDLEQQDIEEMVEEQVNTSMNKFKAQCGDMFANVKCRVDDAMLVALDAASKALRPDAARSVVEKSDEVQK